MFITVSSQLIALFLGGVVELPMNDENVSQEKAEVLATRALRAYLKRDAISAELIEIEAVEWRDSSLGCPQPDFMYTQVITPGYRVVLRVDERNYPVHLAGEQAFVCEKKLQPELPEARADEFALKNLRIKSLVRKAQQALAKELSISPRESRPVALIPLDDGLSLEECRDNLTRIWAEHDTTMEIEEIDEKAPFLIVLQHTDTMYTYRAEGVLHISSCGSLDSGDTSPK